jgi:hypothetical protein
MKTQTDKRKYFKEPTKREGVITPYFSVLDSILSAMN